MLSRRSWKDNAIAYSAAIVAILSLTVALWQGCSSRNHNRLAVRPILMLHSSFDETLKTQGLILQNRGSGPAIVSSAFLYLDDHLIGCVDLSNWRRLLKDSGFWPKIRTSYEGIGKGDAYPAGMDVNMLTLAEDVSLASMSDLKDLIRNHLSLEICYCSMYEECSRTVYANGGGWQDHAECGKGHLSESETSRVARD